MKILKLLLAVSPPAFLVFSLITVAQAGLTRDQLTRDPCIGQPNGIRLVVRDVRSSDGDITVDVHGDNPDSFLKKGAKLMRIREPARVGQVEVCLPVREPGVFAVVAYHDRNSNKRFDRDWVGIPEEPYGISNNPEVLFAAPTHEEASFEVGPDGAVIEIDLRH